MSDVGLARLIVGPDGDQDGQEDSRPITIRGTMGYIDPDELATGELSTASDTYAFGLILLQMLTGITAVKQVGRCVTVQPTVQPCHCTAHCATMSPYSPLCNCVTVQPHSAAVQCYCMPLLVLLQTHDCQTGVTPYQTVVTVHYCTSLQYQKLVAVQYISTVCTTYSVALLPYQFQDSIIVVRPTLLGRTVLSAHRPLCRSTGCWTRQQAQGAFGRRQESRRP